VWALGAFDRPPPPAAAPTTPVVRPTINVSGAAAEVATAVAVKVTPSIVAVEVGDGAFGPNFVPLVAGSGVVIGDGLIVTNHHVIQEGDSVRVVLQDGSIHEATLLGSDADTDLAVLRVDTHGLVAVEVGSTDDLTIGETAIAIGNPLGLSGGASLTVGVLSAFGRQIDTDIDSALFGMLQTDAPITEGSSGGALVDGAGRLIGITTAIGVGSAGAEGIGFAVPVELMQRITDEIIATGEVRHAYLGIELRNELTEREDGALVPAGAVISAFSPDPRSVAQEAGMERGDVIVALNGQPITTREALISDLRMLAAGDVATVEAVRDGELLVFEIELARRPTPP
jgi:S1-C subfamily serine protease